MQTNSNRKKSKEESLANINFRLFKRLNKEREKVKKESKEQIELKKEIVEQNIGLVKLMIIPYTNKKFIGRDKDFIIGYDDIFHEGIAGLYHAIEKYDINIINPKTDKPYAFSSYASEWIKNYAINYLRDNLNLIKIPSYISALLNNSKSENKFIEYAKLTKRRMLSLDHPISRDTSIKHFGLDGESYNPPLLRDFIKDENVSVYDLVESMEIHKKIEELLDNLSPRKEKILRLRYGIGEKKEHTLEEIAEIFKLSKARIGQIVKRTLQDLRHPSKSRHLRSYVDIEW